MNNEIGKQLGIRERAIVTYLFLIAKYCDVCYILARTFLP